LSGRDWGRRGVTDGFNDIANEAGFSRFLPGHIIVGAGLTPESLPMSRRHECNAAARHAAVVGIEVIGKPGVGFNVVVARRP
jgi:hypothetical protein